MQFLSQKTWEPLLHPSSSQRTSQSPAAGLFCPSPTAPSYPQAFLHALVWVLISSPPSQSFLLQSPSIQPAQGEASLDTKMTTHKKRAWKGASPAVRTRPMLLSGQPMSEWRPGVGEWAEWAPAQSSQSLSTYNASHTISSFTSHVKGVSLDPFLQMRKLRGREVMKTAPNLQPRGDRFGL